ncbi:MAG TPA: cation-translocating P-type ATPase, partial [Phycisphaerales bacterium]|nr:cation-translocating P-type ATPase [Phycisphaerales bacterium]
MHTQLAIPAAPHVEGRGEFVLWRARVQLWLSVGAGALLALGFVGERAAGIGGARALYWASLAIGLVYGTRAAILALAERRVDIDVLMVVGAIMAGAVGHAEEGALLLALFTFAGALEELAMARTHREIGALRAVIPDRALALRAGEWVECRPEELRVGEEIRIRPGDRVPVDAAVLGGVSSVDESTLTGESVPRTVEPGLRVYAGAINVDGTLRARVLKVAAESSVQRILELVTEARGQREPLQRLIDRLGQPYTLAVLACSALVFAAWWLALGRAATDAAYTAITLLIVASPCALVIATPTATLAAIARGARVGLLFKGGESIERLSRAGAVCFDKTGTLTRGRPAYRELIARDPATALRLLKIAGELERDSTHPTAASITGAADGAGRESARVTGVRAVAGLGMAGLSDGVEARIGALRFVAEVADDACDRWLRDTLERVRREGQLGVAVALAGGACGVIALRDEVRVGAGSLVGALHGLGIKPVRMLTGDDEIVARRIATELGLDAYDSSLLPEEKVAIVEGMKRERAGEKRPGIAVIGDGVNDAPALAAADVSIAVGSIGSDAALESADIVLLSEDLSRIPWAVRLARATRRTVALNIAFAIAVIACMAALVLAGSLRGERVPMALGVVAHEGGTVAVVLHSLRLLWF